MRALLGAGGLGLFVAALPVALGAWEAQKADRVMTDLRLNRKIDVTRVKQGVAALDRAIAVDPTADHYLERSELLGGGALTLNLVADNAQRLDWARRSRGDLERGLSLAPARGVDWLRLAAMRQTLDGATRDVLTPLFLSLDYAPLVPQTWQPRLRMILDNWPYFSDAQKERVSAYMKLVWRLTATDRRLFFDEIKSPADELIVRYFLRDEPGAQENLTALIKHYSNR